MLSMENVYICLHTVVVFFILESEGPQKKGGSDGSLTLRTTKPLVSHASMRPWQRGSQVYTDFSFVTIAENIKL